MTSISSSPESESLPQTSSSTNSPRLDLIIDLPHLLDELAKDTRCWICYLDYEESSTERWVRPCRCRGTIEFAHEACIFRYIASKNLTKPRCPHCLAEYHMMAPVSILFRFLLRIEFIYLRMLPYICVACVGITTIFMATTHGVHALFVMAGSDAASTWLADEKTGWRLWLSLPFIPVGLCASRIERLDSVLPLLPLWLSDFNSITYSASSETYWPPSSLTAIIVVPWIRHLYNKLRRLAIEQFLVPARCLKTKTGQELLLSLNAQTTTPSVSRESDNSESNSSVESNNNNNEVLPSSEENSERRRILNELVGASDVDRDIPRLVIGALALPILSSSVGKVLGLSSKIRNIFPTQFLRSIVGGCILVVIKDASQIYIRYRTLNLKRSMRIANYKSP